MSDNNQMLALEEFELESFVTTLPENEQSEVVGGILGRLITIIRDGMIWDGLKWVAVELYEFVEANPPPESDTTTDPGFYDTSYPCN